MIDIIVCRLFYRRIFFRLLHLEALDNPDLADNGGIRRHILKVISILDDISAGNCQRNVVGNAVTAEHIRGHGHWLAVRYRINYRDKQQSRLETIHTMLGLGCAMRSVTSQLASSSSSARNSLVCPPSKRIFLRPRSPFFVPARAGRFFPFVCSSCSGGGGRGVLSLAIQLQVLGCSAIFDTGKFIYIKLVLLLTSQIAPRAQAVVMAIGAATAKGASHANALINEPQPSLQLLQAVGLTVPTVYKGVSFHYQRLDIVKLPGRSLLTSQRVYDRLD